MKVVFLRFERLRYCREAISTGGMCATVQCNDAESQRVSARLVTAFESIGNTEALTKGRVGAYWNAQARRSLNWPILEFAGVKLGLAEGVEHYINLHLCDPFENVRAKGSPLSSLMHP